MVMRKSDPDAPRAFKTPLVPLVPILGIFTCLFMMVFLPLDTWIRLIVWMMVGFDIYLGYGMYKSKLSGGMADTVPQGNKIGGATGLGMSILLIIIALIHHATAEQEDTGLLYFSIIFAVIHAVYFGTKMARSKKA